jgi:hypothetical protein
MNHQQQKEVMFWVAIVMALAAFFLGVIVGTLL